MRTSPDCLEVLTGPVAGSSRVLSDVLVLGRETADWDLEDPFVSKRHLACSVDETLFRVRDLGSRNGSFVNGLPLADSWTEIREGDLLRLGATTLKAVHTSELGLGLMELSGGKEQTMDMSALASAKPATEALWLQGLAKVLLSPAKGRELGQALLEVCVADGPFARIAFGQGNAGRGRLAPSYFKARCAADFPLLAEPVKGSDKDGAACLVSDMALDPSKEGVPPGQLFCSAAFVPLSLPAARRKGLRAWVYGDSLGEGRPLKSDDLRSLADLGRFLLGILHREGALSSKEDMASIAVEEQRFLGTSAKVKKLLFQVAKIADSQLPVLLQGESGTGKEIIARMLHSEAKARTGAFVAVNCAALLVNLAESLLFGHKKGAFTGADADEPGMLRASDGGTLFLDELAELPLSLQAKLLRVLEEKEVIPLGASEAKGVDLRVVAATHRDLAIEVAEGRFRSDLAWRLSGVTLVLPPLRERREDILLLASYFIDVASKQEGQGQRELSRRAKKLLEAHDWPGNVRELRHLCHAAVLLCEREVLDAEDFPLVRMPLSNGTDGTFLSLKELERRQIEKALLLADGNKSKAARMLCVDRSSLYDKIRNHAL